MAVKHDLAILTLTLDVEKGHTVNMVRRISIALNLTQEQAKKCLHQRLAKLRTEQPDATLEDALTSLAKTLQKSSDKEEFLSKALAT